MLRSAAILLLLTACSTTPTPSTSASVDPSGSSAPILATPGQPYRGSDILNAMRSSQRPDPVPAAVQTDEVAVGIALAIWTFDGQPWDRMLVGGSCGATCTLEFAGSRDGIEGEDLWTFAVDPAADRVTVTTTSLRALPGALVAQLDEIARAAATQPLDELRLTTSAWVPPPDTEAFMLSYRSGGEEGSCSAEILVGADGSLLDETFTGC